LLSAQRQIDILPSNLTLHSGRSIFFRQIVTCRAADRYFFVNFNPAARQVDILPSNLTLRRGR